MKILDSLNKIPVDEIFSLTIGNFDGVHLGHQKLIHDMRMISATPNIKTAVVSFVPHPRLILDPSARSFLIYNAELKRKALEKLGVDYYIELPFSRDFSALSPQSFLEDYIFVHPGLKHFFLGFDLRLGSQISGYFDLAQKICLNKNISIHQLSSYANQAGQIISSTLIRELIFEGKIKEANSYLSIPFSISSLVVKGEGRGKKIGFPTANIDIPLSQVLPKAGVYVSTVTLRGNQYQSITNIGVNPTFATVKNIQVETHIMNFSQDIYGEIIEVTLFDFIRPEKKFGGLDELLAQIKIDCEYRNGL